MNKNERKGTLKIKRKIEKQKKLIFSIASYVFLFCIIGFLINDNQRLNNELSTKDAEYTKIINEKDTEIELLNGAIKDLKMVVNDLDVQLTEVAKVNQSYVDELNTFREREELYNKYEYAVVYGGERTELTYEEIKLGEQLMTEINQSPHLMFGTVMVESNGIPDAVNPRSGATGHGQFLDSTARFIWENVLGYTGYYPDLRKDGEANIKMMAGYYKYLYNTQGTTFKVIKQYSGNRTDGGTQKYIDKINSFTSQVGVYIN